MRLQLVQNPVAHQAPKKPAGANGPRADGLRCFLYNFPIVIQDREVLLRQTNDALDSKVRVLLLMVLDLLKLILAYQNIYQDRIPGHPKLPPLQFNGSV
jgi:hypothetical protein